MIIEENGWKIIFFVLLMLFTLIRIIFAVKSKQSKVIQSQNLLEEKIKAFTVSLGTFFLPLVYIFTPWLDSFEMNFPLWARYTGFAILFLSLLFFLYVHSVLDKNWSPVLQIKENHELITSGPYKYIRHPMYTQIWMWVAGQFLLVSNWIVGLAGIITWSLLYFTRVNKEENMMIEQFGDKYREYIQTTGKLFPRFF